MFLFYLKDVRWHIIRRSQSSMRVGIISIAGESIIFAQPSTAGTDLIYYPNIVSQTEPTNRGTRKELRTEDSGTENTISAFSYPIDKTCHVTMMFLLSRLRRVYVLLIVC